MHVPPPATGEDALQDADFLDSLQSLSLHQNSFYTPLQPLKDADFSYHSYSPPLYSSPRAYNSPTYSLFTQSPPFNSPPHDPVEQPYHYDSPTQYQPATPVPSVVNTPPRFVTPPRAPPSELPTEEELSRRARAAAGLDVSAPEFVPSFLAKQHATNSPSALSQTVPPLQHAQPMPQATLPHPPVHAMPYAAQQQQQSLSLNHAPPQSVPTMHHPMHIPAPLAHLPHYCPENGTLLNNFDVYNNVTELLSPNLTSILKSPPPPPQNSFEDAVKSFDRQFPALPSAKAAPAPPPDAASKNNVLAPKALGWDALQREEERKAQEKARLECLRATLESVQAAEELPAPEDLIPLQTHDVGKVWVSTGQSVAKLYEELRREAAEQASIRNKFFDRATAAFKRRDGATAKKLGAQGREANERMKELHRKAADAIFTARNPPGVTDVVDFHGLHVSEALERLPAAIERAVAARSEKIRLLTGTGHHTKGTGRARLRPAVKKWLQENEYFFEEVVDANEYVGSFVVDLVKK